MAVFLAIGTGKYALGKCSDCGLLMTRAEHRTHVCPGRPRRPSKEKT